MFDEIIAEVPLVLRWLPASFPRDEQVVQAAEKRREAGGGKQTQKGTGRSVGREEKLRHPPKALCQRLYSGNGLSEADVRCSCLIYQHHYAALGSVPIGLLVLSTPLIAFASSLPSVPLLHGSHPLRPSSSITSFHCYHAQPTLGTKCAPDLEEDSGTKEYLERWCLLIFCLVNGSIRSERYPAIFFFLLLSFMVIFFQVSWKFAFFPWLRCLLLRSKNQRY